MSGSQAIGKISIERVSTTWELPPIDVVIEDIVPDIAQYVDRRLRRQEL